VFTNAFLSSCRITPIPLKWTAKLPGSPVLVHHVTREILLRHMSPKKVSGQCDKQISLTNVSDSDGLRHASLENVPAVFSLLEKLVNIAVLAKLSYTRSRSPDPAGPHGLTTQSIRISHNEREWSSQASRLRTASHRVLWPRKAKTEILVDCVAVWVKDAKYCGVRAMSSSSSSPSTSSSSSGSSSSGPQLPKISLNEAYDRIRSWYTENVDRIRGRGGAEYSAASRRLIAALPERASELEMRAVMKEVLTGLLEWAFVESDGKFSMADYARAALQPFGGRYSLNDEEQADLRKSSALWPYLSYGRSEQAEVGSEVPSPQPTVDQEVTSRDFDAVDSGPDHAADTATRRAAYAVEQPAGREAPASVNVVEQEQPQPDDAVASSFGSPQAVDDTARSPQQQTTDTPPQSAVDTPSPTSGTSGASSAAAAPAPSPEAVSESVVQQPAGAGAGAVPAPGSAPTPQATPTPGTQPTPLPKFDTPPTPKVVSDQWVTADTLGYEAYARALANLITHPDTKPPLTIGIEAPWGAGKTSVMKMIQHVLDGQANLTEENEAGRKNRLSESSISISRLLDALRHPEFDTFIEPKSSALGERYGVPGRATVWFNAWKYQTSEQIWAGLAHCIINHVTVRMEPEQRELFWLKLNSRRVDVNAVRRKVYETVLHDLLPRILGWGIGLVLVLVMVAAFSLLGGTGTYAGLAKKLHWATPLAAVAAALDLWRKWTGAVNTKLREHAKGDLLKLVREPDYEGKMGFLYLVESDVREVLDLVATREKPLVIFIDDLDRCVPHKVAEIVEAVSLFLAGDYPNCIFVLGMEPHVVAAALEVANSDLIKRMDELGLSDTSAPMGWRFMEKIVQLPLVLPPPTKSGLSKYMNALAPAPDHSAPETVVAPDEEQVKRYVDTLTHEATLSNVVAKTEELFSANSAGEAPAVAEASKRVFSRKFDERDPLVRKFLDDAVQTFGANPRQIKRYINLFRLCCNIRHSIWLDATAYSMTADLPTDEEITKYVTFSVQWPQATSLLRRSASMTADGHACSLLNLLEQTAIELQVEPSGWNQESSWRAEAAARWASLLQAYNLLQAQNPASSAWIADPAFRTYLAKGSSLAAAADKGLW
jgi:hypothetical protein